MKTILLTTLIIAVIGAKGQNVNIPDANFKSILLGWTNLNTNGDNEIQYSEAQSYNSNVAVPNASISDLTGIEAFVNIKQLNAENNNLKSIDLSNNTLLEWVYLKDNEIDSIDITQNDSLNYFDSSNNSGLVYLNAANGFNISKLTSFFVSSTPNLSCIQVDDASWSTTNWTSIDATTSFSENCATTVGIKKNENFELSIFPNPTNGIVTFKTDSSIDRIEIYSVTGQLLNFFTHQKTIDFRSLPNGIYTAKIITGSSKPVIERLIKY